LKVSTHHGGRLVTAEEVRQVLDHARPLSVREWAKYFQVHPQTVKGWRSKGLALELWGNPTAACWDAVKAEALANLWKIIGNLEGLSGKQPHAYLPVTF
jgi:hypothetical protein